MLVSAPSHGGQVTLTCIPTPASPASIFSPLSLSCAEQATSQGGPPAAGSSLQVQGGPHPAASQPPPAAAAAALCQPQQQALHPLLPSGRPSSSVPCWGQPLHGPLLPRPDSGRLRARSEASPGQLPAGSGHTSFCRPAVSRPNALGTAVPHSERLASQPQSLLGCRQVSQQPV